MRGLDQVVAVSLGPRVLRAETAALAALACWQAVDAALALRRSPAPRPGGQAPRSGMPRGIAAAGQHCGDHRCRLRHSR